MRNLVLESLVEAEVADERTAGLAAMVADAQRAFVAEATANRVLEQPAVPAVDPWTAAAEMLRELADAALPAFAAAPVWTKGGGQ